VTTPPAGDGSTPRVLMVVTDTDRRGAQVFATDLHAALADRGWAVRTTALAPGRVGGLDLPVLGPSRLHPRTLRALRRAARGADVVVAHGSTTLPACAVALAGTGVPFVYRQISDSLFWASTPARRARVRLGLRRAARVVALWEGSARVLVERFGVDPASVAVVPNGVPAARFPLLPRPDRAARRRLGLDPDRPTVGFVGALVPEKGPAIAIEAVAGTPGAQLVVAGDGPERTALAGLAAQRAPDRVHLVGPVADPLEVYAAADVVVLPSLGGDSMPAVLIEAGLCGVPVVSTPVEGIPEIVVDGETGLLVPVGDANPLAGAIRSLLDDPDRAAALAEAHRARCLERFEITPVAARWASVLADAADPASR
jgi:glycosyltransferase involved in cell wall biosynthesis